MTSRPTARFVGVLGWPLGYSLSPVIHTVAFKALGIDWSYLSFPVPPSALGSAVEGLRALGAMGANVTMPHKETVIAHVDDLSGDAKAVGAVNTIERVGDRLIGHNTDVEGFRSFLADDAGADVEGASCLVLGSGGAARAVVRGLESLGAGSIHICARNRPAALRVAAIAPQAEAHPWDAATGLAAEAGVVVNCTPVGMDLQDPLPGAAWHPGQVVVDLIYSPPTTPLLEAARGAGAEAWGGLGMLVSQAAASFQIWTGRQAPIELMSAAAVRAIGLTDANHVPKELQQEDN